MEIRQPSSFAPATVSGPDSTGHGHRSRLLGRRPNSQPSIYRSSPPSPPFLPLILLSKGPYSKTYKNTTISPQSSSNSLQIEGRVALAISALSFSQLPHSGETLPFLPSHYVTGLGSDMQISRCACRAEKGDSNNSSQRKLCLQRSSGSYSFYIIYPLWL